MFRQYCQKLCNHHARLIHAAFPCIVLYAQDTRSLPPSIFFFVSFITFGLMIGDLENPPDPILDSLPFKCWERPRLSTAL